MGKAEKSRPYSFKEHVAQLKKIAKRARWVPGITPGIVFNVEQDIAREFLFLETLFCAPERIWNDPKATRQLRKDPLWILVRGILAKKLQEWDVEGGRLDKLADFALPAFVIEGLARSNKKYLPDFIKEARDRNAQIRHLSRLEKKAKATGDKALLEHVDSRWPRDFLTGEREELIPLANLRQFASKRRRPRIQHLPRFRQPQLVAFRRATISELTTKWGFTKEKATKLIADIEKALGISSLTTEISDHGKNRRVSAILKSL